MLSWLCWTEERKASPTENEWAMSSLFWQSKAAFLTTSVWSRMEVLGSQAGNHRERSIVHTANVSMYECINVSQPLSDINKVVVWTHGRALDDQLWSPSGLFLQSWDLDIIMAKIGPREIIIGHQGPSIPCVLTATLLMALLGEATKGWYAEELLMRVL